MQLKWQCVKAVGQRRQPILHKETELKYDDKNDCHTGVTLKHLVTFPF